MQDNNAGYSPRQELLLTWDLLLLDKETGGSDHLAVLCYVFGCRGSDDFFTVTICNQL